MKLSFEVAVNSTAEKVWSFYENVDKWKLWDPEIEVVTLRGKFVSGTSGLVTIAEMSELPFMFEEVIPLSHFISSVNISYLGIKILQSCHIKTKNKKIYIEHSSELTGKDNFDRNDFSLLHMIFVQTPPAVIGLKQLCEQ